MIEEMFKVMAGFVGPAVVAVSAGPIPKTTGPRVVSGTDCGHRLGPGALGESCARVLSGS